MNRNIGEVFYYNGVKLKVVDEHEGGDRCKGCYFKLHNIKCTSIEHQLKQITGHCSISSRGTSNGVKFIEIKEDKNMKTNEEILEYIKKQDWYEAFCKNFVKSSISNYDGRKSLSLDSALIARAFNWSCTSEGHDYWCKIFGEYYCWYNQQPITELTLEQIAKKFEIDVKQLRIKDNE